MSAIPAIASYRLPTRADLPATQARWTADPARAVLLIHDMQRYFLAPFDSPLREELIAHAAQLRDLAIQSGVPIAYTAQPGDMTPQQRGLLEDFWGPGMTAGPEHRKVVPELAPRAEDKVFTKWRYSAFFKSTLLDWMKESHRDQLVLCGVFAHIGVLTTALDAFTHDIQPFFVADAVGDFSAEHHQFAMTHSARSCARVLLTEEVLHEFTA
ncbi:isochorismatase family protein [Pseudonocardiaceae bacterium YIM PH 21723]|nr:isochorismatase family protein [Pseudonocardiaceae bacterium YIM PH 21723]